jgi:hypothetical protein
LLVLVLVLVLPTASLLCFMSEGNGLALSARLRPQGRLGRNRTNYPYSIG